MRMKTFTRYALVRGVCLVAGMISLGNVAWADDDSRWWMAPESYLHEVFAHAANGIGVDSTGSAKGDDRPQFQRLAVTGLLQFGPTAEKMKGNWQYTSKFYNLTNDGTLQQIVDVGGNGFVVARKFLSAYGGMIMLRSQTIHPNETASKNSIIVASNISQWVPFTKMTEDGEFDFQFALSSPNHPREVAQYNHCHTGHFYEASSINTALHGKAIDITCKYGVNHDDGSVVYNYLMNYGVGLLHNEISASEYAEYSVQQVDITP
jgi:hypothetical protein